MKKTPLIIMSGARLKRVQNYLELAGTYLDDGAQHSARCCIEAAMRVTKGEPVPRGQKFWHLFPIYD